MHTKTLVATLIAAGALIYLSARPSAPPESAEAGAGAEGARGPLSPPPGGRLPERAPAEPAPAPAAPAPAPAAASARAEEREGRARLAERPSAAARAAEVRAVDGEGEGEGEEGEGEGEEEGEEMVFSVDREGIKSAILEMNEQVRECYRGWRASNPALEGRVVLSFTISPPESGAEGTPEGAAAGVAAGRSLIKEAALLVDDLKHPMMSACLLNSAEGLRFEPVSAPMVVNYPYRFAASPSDEP